MLTLCMSHTASQGQKYNKRQHPRNVGLPTPPKMNYSHTE